MLSVFSWDGFKGEFGLSSTHLLCPFLSYISLHVDGFVLLWFSDLSECPFLNPRDILVPVFVSRGLKTDFSSQEYSFLPVDRWLEDIEKRISQNDAVLS